MILSCVRYLVCWCSHAGPYCEVDIDECASQPCLNGGNCTDLVAGYNCTCPSDYVDGTCATPYCHDNDPCANSGTCYSAGLCSCPPGYTGACSVSLTAYNLRLLFQNHRRCRGSQAMLRYVRPSVRFSVFVACP